MSSLSVRLAGTLQVREVEVRALFHTQDGGVWVNLGPLLFHWADAHLYLPGDEMGIELPLEDVKRIALQLGFTCLREEVVPATYMNDPR